jgi:hypothetical protein
VRIIGRGMQYGRRFVRFGLFRCVTMVDNKYDMCTRNGGKTLESTAERIIPQVTAQEFDMPSNSLRKRNRGFLPTGPSFAGTPCLAFYEFCEGMRYVICHLVPAVSVDHFFCSNVQNFSVSHGVQTVESKLQAVVNKPGQQLLAKPHTPGRLPISSQEMRRRTRYLGRHTNSK